MRKIQRTDSLQNLGSLRVGGAAAQPAYPRLRGGCGTAGGGQARFKRCEALQQRPRLAQAAAYVL